VKQTSCEHTHAFHASFHCAGPENDRLRQNGKSGATLCRCITRFTPAFTHLFQCLFPPQVRKATWKDRAAETSTERQKWSHALSVHNPKQKRKLHSVLEAKRPHVHMKKKGMPW
jgi:hypothetical protein